MFQLYLFQFVLFGGTLAGPFRLGDVEPGYDQVAVRAAMAPDGRFAAAWIDSIGTSENYKLWIRFYDKSGNPLTDQQEIVKLVDTNYITQPCLDMDNDGRSILLWSEGSDLYSDSLYIRFQRFDRDGKALDIPKSVWIGNLPQPEPCIGLGCNLAGEFAVVWGDEKIRVQRCDSSGNLLGDAFLAHDSFPEGYRSYFRFPSVDLNDSGDIAVTWLEAIQTGQCYPRYQVFDKENQSILPWNGEGHRLDTFYMLPGGQLGYDGTRLEVHWLDNQRFAAFWFAYGYEGYPINFMGKVLSDKGLTKPPRQVLMRDTLARYGGYWGWYSTDVCGERFVMGYDRQYCKQVDTITFILWQHQGGFLGQVVDNEPQSTTAIFEVSPPLGKDTIADADPQPPAVACNNDRIVWVYSRLEPDTTWKAYFLITDWDMSAIAEPPPSSPVTPVTHPVTHFNSVGREIILHYSDCPQGFHAAIYDASGRKVDEIYSPQTQGIIQWGGGRGPGVYFIVPDGSKGNPLKVVLVR